MPANNEVLSINGPSEDDDDDDVAGVVVEEEREAAAEPALIVRPTENPLGRVSPPLPLDSFNGSRINMLCCPPVGVFVGDGDVVDGSVEESVGNVVGRSD